MRSTTLGHGGLVGGAVGGGEVLAKRPRDLDAVAGRRVQPGQGLTRALPRLRVALAAPDRQHPARVVVEGQQGQIAGAGRSGQSARAGAQRLDPVAQLVGGQPHRAPGTAARPDRSAGGAQQVGQHRERVGGVGGRQLDRLVRRAQQCDHRPRPARR